MLLLLFIKLYIISKENNTHKFKAYIYLENNCLLKCYTKQEARTQRKRGYNLELIKVMYGNTRIKLDKQVNTYISRAA